MEHSKRSRNPRHAAIEISGVGRLVKRASTYLFRLWGMGFTTPNYGLTDLFSRIDRGDLQLPDFQRAYAWDVDRIRSLIVTVLRGYPMGALMALDTRNEPMRFRPRPLSGAPDTGQNPGLLLLDGQQRLTTLYHCFRGNGQVNTADFRGKKITRSFFVDVHTAVSEGLMPDEAVFAVDEEGRVRSHFGPGVEGSLLDKEVALAHGCLPVAALLTEEGTSMLFELVFATSDTPERREEIAAFNNRILRPLAGYRTPMIRLARETGRAGVGSIFAQANSAGLQMDVFELLTAVFANEREDFRLGEHWRDVEAQLRRFPALDGIGRTEFLQAVSLYVTATTGQAGGQREDILRLSLDQYLEGAKAMVPAFASVAVFFARRCIFTRDQVPYTAQVIPLAVILAQLGGHTDVLANEQARDRINQWFWCGVFGELYGSSAVKLRSARDVVEVTRWARGETEEKPKTVVDATFYESRFLTANDADAIYHAFYSLLMARGARDWRSAQPFDRHTVADLVPGFHWIYPREWCESHGVDPQLAGSVLNLAPMGKRTWVVIDGRAPKRYLPRVQSKSLMEDSEFDAVLESHEIDPELVRRDDPQEFWNDRRARFIGIIEYAMDKPVVRDMDGV